MKILLAATAALIAAGLCAPASARSSQEYFQDRLSVTRAPRQLNDEDTAYYRQVFDAIDQQQWSTAQTLLAQRENGLLHRMAQAELYLAKGSPRVEGPQIEAWLAGGTDLPQAGQLLRLGQTRGLTALPSLPAQLAMVTNPTAPRRTRPRTVEDGTMPAGVRQALLEKIDEDDPEGARLLLDGIDALLSPAARAEWRQRIAWSYYIGNFDAQALAMAQTVPASGEGAWVAEAEFTTGLASFRQGDCATAGPAFERAAYGAQNPELRSAAFYWASRAALRCREPERTAELLRGAASNDDTLYGMLAAQQLGRKLPARHSTADLSDSDWHKVDGITNVRVAVALAEIQRTTLASTVLLHQARIGDPDKYEVLSRLARDLGMPSTQLYMAYNTPVGGRSDPASMFPAPKWAPLNGWRVDPALAFAHTLQESNFQTRAVSPAQAQGLMQITPITVRQHAPALGLGNGQVNIFDPATNLAFGQRNLEMLRDDPGTQGRLPKIMAAYNAGLVPIRRWSAQVNDQNDPLLYMESIPYWETRSYVAIVMRNYWMYERQAQAPSPSRAALAQNQWPKFPGVED
ncbi:MAG: hypothetical protein RLZZ08_1920 [Pseudomonadota bacterium]|jgi:soluble lytic murein transglycosylase-like protein